MDEDAGVALAVTSAAPPLLEGTSCTVAVVVLVESAAEVGNGDWMRTVVATVGIVGVVTTFTPERAFVEPLGAVCSLTGCENSNKDQH